MAEKKMTRVDALAIAIAALEDSNVPNDVEAVEILSHMVEQLKKPKAGNTTGKSKTRIENENLAKQLHNLAPDTPFDGKFVMEHLQYVTTPQKVVGMMKTGIEMGLFIKLKEGKRTVYQKTEWP